MATWADFASSALDRLGSLAPLIIIAALAAFGVYKLQEQNTANYERLSKTAQVEREQARKDFETANDALKGTYNATNELYTSMLTSMSDTLERMRELESTLQNKQQTFLESELENERTKLELDAQRKDLEEARQELSKISEDALAQTAIAEAATAKAAEANSAAEDARARAFQLDSQLARGRAQLDESQKELAAIRAELKTKRDEFDVAVQRLTEVRGLVGEVAELPPGATAEQIEALTARARKITPKLADFLMRYEEDPDSRDKLDPSELVGLTLSELRVGIESSSGIAWYLGSHGEDTSIIGLPLDLRLEPYVPSALLFTVSNVSMEEVARYFREGNGDIKIAGASIARAKISYTIAYQCVGAYSLEETGYGFLSEGTGQLGPWRPRDELNLIELLKNGFGYAKVVHLKAATDWSIKYLVPREMWERAPLLTESITKWGTDDIFARCFSLFRERERLARLEIAVIGLEPQENKMMADRLTEMFRTVFHPEQAFSGQIDLSEFTGGDSEIGLGDFLLLIARSALADSLPLSTATPVLDLIAERDDEEIAVRLANPSPNLSNPFSGPLPHLLVRVSDGEMQLLRPKLFENAISQKN